MAKITTITNPLTGQPAQVDQLEHTAQQIDDGLNIARGVSNPNLLDNWYFGNPVNQRGQTSYTGVGYGIDRWIASNPYTVLIKDGYLQLISGVQNGFYGQYLDGIFAKLSGKTVTISVLAEVISGEAYLNVRDGTSVSKKITNGLTSVTKTIISAPTEDRVVIYATEGAVINVYAAKLELGTTQTLAHQDSSGNWVLNEIPDYGEQLARCQRYFCRMYCKCSPKNSSAAYDDQNGGFISFPVTMRTNPAGALISKEVSTISLGETTVNGFDVGGADNYSRSFVADFTADL